MDRQARRQGGSPASRQPRACCTARLQPDAGSLAGCEHGRFRFWVCPKPFSQNQPGLPAASTGPGCISRLQPGTGQGSGDRLGGKADAAPALAAAQAVSMGAGCGPLALLTPATGCSASAARAVKPVRQSERQQSGQGAWRLCFRFLFVCLFSGVLLCRCSRLHQAAPHAPGLALRTPSGGALAVGAGCSGIMA